MERAGSLRLGYGAVAQAFGCALVNWLADVCWLICAMFALGVPVPWARILVAWTAGSGAVSFSPASTCSLIRRAGGGEAMRRVMTGCLPKTPA